MRLCAPRTKWLQQPPSTVIPWYFQRLTVQGLVNLGYVYELFE